jgi:hypothetical protein
MIKIGMKKIVKCVVLTVGLLAFSSCGREKLTPLYQAVTVNQLNNDQAVNFSYELEDTQIDEYAKDTKKFPLFGRLFQGIAVVLANASISSEGHELDLPPVDVDLSSLTQVDFDMIQYINLDSLMVSVRNAKNRDSLEFVEKLEILIKLDSPVEGLPTDEKGYAKILYFDSSKNSLRCDGRCIKFNIADVDWKKLLQKNKFVRIQPKLVINSVPKSTMKLAGSINFSVKFNLGF